MSKKSINDPDFFEDENIDAMADEIAPIDPDAGVDDAVAADESVGSDDAAEEAAGDPSDSEDSDGEPVADEQSEDTDADPAPHLNDLETAKVAYAELRKWANQRDMEARKAAERLAELEAAQNDTSFEYDYDDTPEYDPQAFAYMTAQDPRAGFRYALDGGNDADAQAAIAKVQADAQEVAAMAALAHRDGDREAYQQLNQQAVNLNSLAQSMHAEFNSVVNARAQAPLHEFQRNQNLAAAEHQLAQQFPEYPARRQQVIQVLRQQPNLIADHSVQGIHAGLRAAYAIAALEPAPTSAAPSAQDIDSVVKQAVERHIAETRKAKARAADAASGDAGDRVSPGGGAQEPSLKDMIYQDQANASIGARRFMAL
jgi:hypothetical protein